MTSIETLITQGRLEEALAALLQARPADKTAILTLQTRLSELKREEMLGTQGYEALNLQRNRLIKATLQLMATPAGSSQADSTPAVPVEPPAQGDPAELAKLQAEIEALKGQGKGQTEPTLKKRILFLAANPQQATRIRTDEEHRILKAEFERGAEARSHYEFLPSQFALTLGELTRALDAEPQLIHFAGHGQAEGIIITDDQGQAQMLPEPALKRICKRKLAGTTEVVILNACFSTLQAELISTFDIHVIGTSSAVLDDAALVFSRGFYNALGRNRTWQDCYDDGMLEVETHHADQATYFEAWYQGKRLDW